MALTAFLSLLALLALLALQAAAQGVKYFQIGGSLTLNPNHPQAITSITWKHKGNIVAEHIKGVVDLDYLGDFKGRAELNKTTGILTIRNLRKSDDGRFTVEINNIVLPVQFDAVGINPLPKSVEIIQRPLTCSSHADNCFLDCDKEFTDVGPVKYFWKKGETGEWEEGNIRLVISRETEQVETFTCRAETPISNVTSAPHNNPYKKPEENVLLVILLVLSFLILAAGAGVSVWLIITKPQWVQNILNRQSGQPTENRKELEGLNSDRNPESGQPHPESPGDS